MNMPKIDFFLLFFLFFFCTAWVTLVNRGAVKMNMPKIELDFELGPLHLVVSESAV